MKILKKYKYIFGLSLFVFLLSRFDYKQIFEALISINPLYFIVSLVVYYLSFIVRAHKWHLFLPEINIITIIKSNFISAYYSLLLTGPMAGDSVKVYKLSRQEGLTNKIVTSTILDNITGFFAIPLVGIIGILPSDNENKMAILASFLLFSSGFILLLSLPLLLKTRIFKIFICFLESKSYFYKIVAFIKQFTTEYARINGQWSRIFLSILLGVLFQFFCVTINYIICLSLHLSVHYLDLAWVITLVSIGMNLPVTVAGLGVRELGMVAFLGLIGVPGKDAMTASLLIFSLQLIGASTGFLCDFFQKQPCEQ